MTARIAAFAFALLVGPRLAHAVDCGALAARLAAVESARGATSPAAHRLARTVADRCVHLNEIQVVGTHNSYHVEQVPQLMDLLLAFDRPLFETLQYSHPALDVQFDTQGIRQIELDVFADPQGGLYRLRRTLPLIGESAVGPAILDQPGLKVLHVQDVDFQSNCLTFDECLRTVKSWSDRHRGHVPIMVLVEAKDDPIPDPLNLGFTVPLPIDAAMLDEIDAEIRAVFPARHVITPDDVRGPFRTLDAAVRARGWPVLQQARGKVLFTLDNGGRVRDLYAAGHPALEGRVLFTNATPGAPDAGFVEHNDAGGPGDVDEIRTLIETGYVVRTRADADTVQSRANDPTTRDAALASGAQWVSTDYPVPDLRFSTYAVRLPGDAIARCNPVIAPAGCRDDALERLR